MRFLEIHMPISENAVNQGVAKHLQSRGYEIVSQALGKQHGKDIVAKHGGTELWVTVKGYPKITSKTRPETQARHYFRDAVFDIIDWRNCSKKVELAVALPDRKTYRNAATRTTGWLQEKARFRFLWFDDVNGVTE